jgi:hypothetical protein
MLKCCLLPAKTCKKRLRSRRVSDVSRLVRGTEAGVRRFDRMPTLAKIEGKPWVLLSHDVAAGTRYRLSPFPYDPSHLVLCTCGQFVGPPQDSPGVIGRSSSGQPDPGGTPASWRVDQVDGKYWLRADGALMPQFTMSPFEWDPTTTVRGTDEGGRTDGV